MVILNDINFYINYLYTLRICLAYEIEDWINLVLKLRLLIKLLICFHPYFQ